ncbi:MAG: hypothetical protein RL885_25865 [Planctomycetota bacterium]
MATSTFRKVRDRSAARSQRREIEGRRRRRLLFFILPIVAIVIVVGWLTIQHFVVRGERYRQLVHNLHERDLEKRLSARDGLIAWGSELEDDLVELMKTDGGEFGYPTVGVLDALGASDRVSETARIGYFLDVIQTDPGGWFYDAKGALAGLVEIGAPSVRASVQSIREWGVWDLSSPSLSAMANLAIALDDPEAGAAWAELLSDDRPARLYRVCDVAAFVLLELWDHPQLLWKMGMPELHGDEEFDLHFLAPIYSKDRGLSWEMRSRIVDHVRSLVESDLGPEERRNATITQMMEWVEDGPIGDAVDFEFLKAAWLRRLEDQAGRSFQDWNEVAAWWETAQSQTQIERWQAAFEQLTGRTRPGRDDLEDPLSEPLRARLANHLLEAETGESVWGVAEYFAHQRQHPEHTASRLAIALARVWESLPARWIVRWPLDQAEGSEVQSGVDIETEWTAEDASARLEQLSEAERERLESIRVRVSAALEVFQRSNYERRDLSGDAVPWTHLIWPDEGQILPMDIASRWASHLDG